MIGAIGRRINRRPTWTMMMDLRRTYLADPSKFESIRYDVEKAVATITLNRPKIMNAIDERMPLEIRQAVELANDDKDVKVIVVTGAGRAFCSGYDLKKFAESPRGTTPGSQRMPWDPYEDFKFMNFATEQYMSLWRSLKPTVAKINGVCVGGGTDIALACDVSFIAEDAPIGYPPARLWGCPTGAMWAYKLGMERAKRVLFTGELLDGRRAVEIGLIGECAPADGLDRAVEEFLRRVVTVPTNQLFFQKQVINNVFEMMGLASSQRLAVFMDGMTRHTPEGVEFQKRCEQVGFKQAVMERDYENSKL